MYTLSKKVTDDLDKLADIGKKYRENTVTDSMFYDIVNGYYRSDVIKRQECEQYLSDKGINIVSTELEIEDMDEKPSLEDNIKPYDPTEIDVSLRNISLSLIVARLENDEIDLMPDFQRKGGLWSQEQKSQLIESLILKIPLPAFYFDGSAEENWIVIDGLQRLTAIKEFFVDKTLKLTGMEFLRDLNGVVFDNLPRVYQRRMNETQIVAYIVNPGAPVNLKYNIFKRINTGGLCLEPQEIRHALYQGFATAYLKRLAELEEFKKATSYSVSSDRMLDREFALRFVAFYESGYASYKGAIDFFLNNAMDYINKNFNKEYADNLMKTYIDSLNTCYNIFGKYAFRKMPDKKKRRPINKALFETWTVTIAYYTRMDMEILVKCKEQVCDRFMELCRDNKEFDDALKSAKVVSVRKRFEVIGNLVKEVLNEAEISETK